MGSAARSVAATAAARSVAATAAARYPRRGLSHRRVSFAYDLYTSRAARSAHSDAAQRRRGLGKETRPLARSTRCSSTLRLLIFRNIRAFLEFKSTVARGSRKTKAVFTLQWVGARGVTVVNRIRRPNPVVVFSAAPVTLTRVLISYVPCMCLSSFSSTCTAHVSTCGCASLKV